MGRPKKITIDTSSNSSDINDSKISHLTPKYKCNDCGKEYDENEFYVTTSLFFSNGRTLYCKNCIEKIYNSYCERFEAENHVFPEKKAIRRICMALDIYYSDSLFDMALKNTETMNTSIIAAYMKLVHLVQYKKKTYDTTIYEENNDGVVESYVDLNNNRKAKTKTIKFFGSGFSDDDYLFLQEEYDDWTARHECKTKAQEEIFKQICFTQLELLKATRAKQDTKDLTATFQKLLETAKLQPKQNSNETISDTQTFGTLIDKWENTRPLPDIDEELKDVDKIGKYLNIFFRGHLAKMMGIKNSFCKAYEDFMQKYSVKRPEYNSDEDTEALFDSIFGGDLTDE